MTLICLTYVGHLVWDPHPLPLPSVNYNNNLDQLVSNPTHITGNNYLDLVIVNTDFVSDLSINSLCSNSLLLSDHFSITFTVKQSIPLLSNHSKFQYLFDISKVDLAGLADYLLDFDFSACFKSNDTEFIWSIIRQSIITANASFHPNSETETKTAQMVYF